MPGSLTGRPRAWRPQAPVVAPGTARGRRRAGGQLSSSLDGLRHRRTPGEPHGSDEDLGAHPLSLVDGLVVEAAGELDAVPGPREGVEERLGLGERVELVDLVWVVEDSPQRRGERTLGLRPLVAEVTVERAGHRATRRSAAGAPVGVRGTDERLEVRDGDGELALPGVRA